MHLIENERVKLTAAYLNGLAIAFMVVGSIGPVLALASQGMRNAELLAIAILALGCLAISLALHYLGRWLLGELKHD
jgi:hypothetical protein